MQYFVRQTYINDIDAEDDGGDGEELAAACKAYSERLEEIRDDLPKSVRKLLDDPAWADSEKWQFVNDHFYLEPSEELTFLIESGGSMFVFRYTVDAMPVVEAPEEEDRPYFNADAGLEIKADEWDLEGGKVVHRVLLNNGYVVTFRPKEFHWWKTKVEAHG